jgi:septum formation protein
LLSQIGIIPSKVIPSTIDETPAQREKPAELSKRLAEAKAIAVADQNPNYWVLGADTLVACGRRIIGKASNKSEARAHLEMLSGRRHRVFGGICLIDPDGKRRIRLVTTVVVFKRLNRDDIESFISLGEWQGKAGAYAIQGAASAFIPKIIGSYTNVVGLALAETALLLNGSGYRPD